jgi:transcriptional regulator with XRE-family HTH domain
MKNENKSGQAVQKLRKILNLSQAQFASMIGSGRPTVIAWENRVNNVSPEFREMIQDACGARVMDDGAVRDCLMGADYTMEFYREFWQRAAGFTADDYSRVGAERLKLLFSTVQRPDRLKRMWSSFLRWEEQTIRAFGLQQKISSYRKNLVRVSVMDDRLAKSLWPKRGPKRV